MHDHIATQAQKAMHLLYDNIRKTVGHLSPPLILKMFDTHVLPILEYNNEIWFSSRKIDSIEKIQLQFLKNMLGVRRQTPSIGILADTGRFPLIIRQHLAAVKYLQRLNSNDCPTILRKCLQIQKQIHNSGKECWYKKLHKSMDQYNITEFNEPRKIPSAIYQHTHDNLFREISDSTKNPKLRTYKNFKTEMRIEPYLNLGLPKKLYCSVARFRLSSHNLQIELGRHKRPFVQAEDRKCTKCNMNKVEDEEHYLMVCPMWDHYRLNLLHCAISHIQGFLVYNQNQQFLEIMKSKVSEVNYALGSFLYSSFNHGHS